MKKWKKKLFVTTEEALAIISGKTPTPVAMSVPVMNAQGYILAADVRSQVNSPPFDQSAMDGYALMIRDITKQLVIAGESSAGKAYMKKIKPGEAVRIFTGARIPPGADTVVIREKTKSSNGTVSINDSALKRGANIRLKGSAVGKKEIVALKGSLVQPGSIGLFASLGIESVKIYKAPSACIIITGDELKKSGTTLKENEIYESNSYALTALLNEYGVKKIKTTFARDRLSSVQKAVHNGLEDFDITIITGGISAGDYDFTLEALENEGIELCFYTVRQKPGKPLFFGRKGRKLVFGLPGNPAAVMTCFYEYVYPAIRRMMGHQKATLPVLHLPVSSPYIKKNNLTHFLKAHTDFKIVKLLEGQESYKMNAFHNANCLVKIPAGAEKVNVNDVVEVHFFGI